MENNNDSSLDEWLEAVGPAEEEDLSLSESSLASFEPVLVNDLEPSESSDQSIQDDDVDLASDHEQQPREDYDLSLPAQHVYLGSNLHELSGRVVLDDESVVDIPILHLAGVVLIPGQILPLQLEHPTLVAMILSIIEKDRTFGIVAEGHGIGTTVEIRSYSQVNNLPGAYPVGGGGGENSPRSLRIKAEGRQRFKLMKSWRLHDGFLMGKVKILRDVEFIHPFDKDIGLSCRGNKFNRKLLPVVTVLPYFLYKLYDPYFMMKKINQQLHNWANVARPSPNNPIDTKIREVHESVSTSQDSGGEGGIKVRKTMVTTIRTDEDSDSTEEESENEKEDFSQTLQCPFKYAYWLAGNLPLSDEQRVELLKIPTTIGRLKFEYDLLQKCLNLCCKACGAKICAREDIFSMNVEGPLQNYVNQGGHVHETLTVYNAANLSLQGRPSSEQSWFPGYSWIICVCSNCSHHIGWKFISTKKIRPEYFWGISRANIKPQSAIC